MVCRQLGAGGHWTGRPIRELVRLSIGCELAATGISTQHPIILLDARWPSDMAAIGGVVPASLATVRSRWRIRLERWLPYPSFRCAVHWDYPQR